MKDIEQLFNNLRSEINIACTSFYTVKEINDIASDDSEILKALRENSRSWKIIIHSLQNTFFVTLGRLFDGNGDAFSIQKFLKACIENIDQFSIESLRKREYI